MKGTKAARRSSRQGGEEPGMDSRYSSDPSEWSCLQPGATVAAALAWGWHQMPDQGMPDQGSGQAAVGALLADVMACDRSRLIAFPETVLTPAQNSRFTALCRRFAGGEPLAHLRGWVEFWSLPLSASPDALVPRPETELLVELALEAAHSKASGQLLDLGTGSGAIALAFAHEKPTWQVYGLDRSRAALAQAERDRERLGLGNVHFLQQDWNAARARRAETVDIIVSNPPYIAAGDPDLEDSVLCHEPAEALFAGDDGLSALSEVISFATARLVERGELILEHGWRQRAPVAKLLEQHGFSDYSVHQDLAARPRAIRARRPLRGGVS